MKKIILCAFLFSVCGFYPAIAASTLPDSDLDGGFAGGDNTEITPSPGACIQSHGSNCSSSTYQSTCQFNGQCYDVYTCNICNDGYTKKRTSHNICGTEYYTCEKNTCTCPPCNTLTENVSTWYIKKQTQACNLNKGCICEVTNTTYSCSSDALQTANTVNCNGSSCSGCSACPTDATCNGSKTFTCKSNTYKTDTECKACPTGATCNGTTTFTCNNGYYKSGNSCKSCPSNATCTNGTDFKCKSGYYKSGDSCKSCPSNATCTNGTDFKCNDRYYKSGDICKSCPANSTCTSATDFTCDDEYCKSGNRCEKVPDNAKCVDDVIKCNANYYKSGSSCKSCGSIKIGDQTITATSDVGATSKSDCRVPDNEINEEKDIEINGHTATIKIKSCY